MIFCWINQEFGFCIIRSTGTHVYLRQTASTMFLCKNEFQSKSDKMLFFGFTAEQECINADTDMIARGPVRGQLFRKAKVKSLRMTALIVAAFIVCWTPYYVVFIIFTFTEYTKLDQVFNSFPSLQKSTVQNTSSHFRDQSGFEGRLQICLMCFEHTTKLETNNQQTSFRASTQTRFSIYPPNLCHP